MLTAAPLVTAKIRNLLRYLLMDKRTKKIYMCVHTHKMVHMDMMG